MNTEAYKKLIKDNPGEESRIRKIMNEYLRRGGIASNTANNTQGTV